MDRTLQKSKLFNSKHNSNAPGLPFQTKGCPVPLLPPWREGVTDPGFPVKKPCGSHTQLCPSTSTLLGQKGSLDLRLPYSALSSWLVRREAIYRGPSQMTTVLVSLAGGASHSQRDVWGLEPRSFPFLQEEVGAHSSCVPSP